LSLRHGKEPADCIEQSKLSLTFGLADVLIDSSEMTSSKEGRILDEEDVVKALALKVLEIWLFLGIQLQCLDFSVFAIYYMARTMMKGMAQKLANVAMKEMVKSLMNEGEEGIKKEAAKTAANALRHWKGWPKKPLLHAPFDSSLYVGKVSKFEEKLATSYLASIYAKATSCIFENVPLIGIVSTQVYKDANVLESM